MFRFSKRYYIIVMHDEDGHWFMDLPGVFAEYDNPEATPWLFYSRDEAEAALAEYQQSAEMVDRVRTIKVKEVVLMEVLK